MHRYHSEDQDKNLLSREEPLETIAVEDLGGPRLSREGAKFPIMVLARHPAEKQEGLRPEEGDVFRPLAPKSAKVLVEMVEVVEIA